MRRHGQPESNDVSIHEWDPRTAEVFGNDYFVSSSLYAVNELTYAASIGGIHNE